MVSSAALSSLCQQLHAFNETCGQRSADELHQLEEQHYQEAFEQLEVATKAANKASIPTFFLKSRNPDAENFLEKVSAAAVTLELDVRASQIEEFDTPAHKKVFDLLSRDGSRLTISMDEYMEAMTAFRAWQKQRVLAGLPSHADAPSTVPVRTQLLDEVPLSELAYVPVAQPRISLDMFISCPRNPSGRVDVKLLFQKFSKQVSLIKCEAELMMWDADNDGKLNEEELEAYVKYLIPSVPCLRKLAEESIPFYCCAVNRRIFWALDPTNRGYIKIHDLVRSQIMDEWLDLQLTHEDPPRNWFSLTITSQLYEKFLTLDTNETGMLTAKNMQTYKKGIPMVVDDGLPPHYSPISNVFIDRVFETTALYKSEMDYKGFVDFVIAVEFLPQCSRPQFFWNIFDIHESGVLTPMTVMHFFRDTYMKLIGAGVEAPPLELVVQELFDIIPTKEPLRITRHEFLTSSQAGLFSALVIDCLAFWTYENREQK